MSAGSPGNRGQGSMRLGHDEKQVTGYISQIFASANMIFALKIDLTP